MGKSRRRREARVRWWAMAVLFSASLAGCWGTKTYPVEGFITLDGQPVAEATVTFHPVADLPIGHAVTRSDGGFRLESHGGNGLPAGEYKVTVIKQKFHWAGGKTQPGASPLDSAMGWRIEWLLPKPYGNPETSGLKVNVPAAPGSYEFKLTNTKGLARE